MGSIPPSTGGALTGRRIGILMWSDAWGGAELHTLALVERLTERGHHCVIVELNQPVIAERPDRVPAGVEVMSVQLGQEPGATDLGPAIRFLRQLAADVGIFAKSWTRVGSLRLELACRLAFAGRFLTIEHLMPPPRGTRTSKRHFRGLVPGLGLHWYRRGLEVYVRSLFPNRIVTVSRAVAEELEEDYWFPARKLVPVPNGIDPDRFLPDAAARRRSRAAWGIPSDSLVFGSMGRLSIPDKGLDVSIDLFARLCEAHPDLPLDYVLVGEGRHEARLKEQAAASGWGERMHFPGQTEEPWEAYCGMDVLLMPSRLEGIGFALLEAMACGCCPVAMGVSGVRDVLTDPTLGWIVPSGDRERFLQGMEDALSLGPSGRAAMGLRARAHVMKHFRAAEQYGKLVNVIERL